MFKSSNFCHVASNNRNNVKAGLFVYRTTDDLETVTANGYFNSVLIDLKLHDLIIHEKYDATDNTKVQHNVLCVTERTLDNVGTKVVLSQWEGDIEEDIATLRRYVDDHFIRRAEYALIDNGLNFNSKGMIRRYGGGGLELGYMQPSSSGVGLTPISLVVLMKGTAGHNNGYASLEPYDINQITLGSPLIKWVDLYLSGKAYIPVINNGYDIAVPVTNSADTFALKSQVDDAANSGEQLYTTGVWFAKMYAATTVPTGAEYDGTNYADFSQVDNDNEPIIVVYEGQSGAWVQIATITPPKNHNGYMTITSKIWDIVEQTGQQGGKVLWSHNNKTFTPYPLIISFESAHLTGDSTVDMPLNPTSNSIVNKNYVDSIVPHLSSQDLFDWKMTDHLLSNPMWARTDTFAWQDGTVYTDAYNHLLNDYQNNTADFYAWAITTPSPLTIYTASETPKVGDWLYILHNGKMMDADRVIAVGSGSITADTLGTANRDSTSDTTVADNALLETIAGTTITYYLAPDGHKICLPNEEAHVEAIFAATGVAWYYILQEGENYITTSNGNICYRDSSKDGQAQVNPDLYPYAWDYNGNTTFYTASETPSVGDYTYMNGATEFGTEIISVVNTPAQFKLPRTQHNFVGYRDAVGGYVAPGAPNITGTFKATSVTQYGNPKGHITETTGAFSGVSGSNANTDGGDGGANTFGTVTLNASTSSSVYGNSTTIQPPATQMYLYLYLGQGS